MILLDTNILARIAQPAHPHYKPSIDAIDQLTANESEDFIVAAQSLYEFYFVLTKVRNGFGYTPAKAFAEIKRVKSVFQLLPESPTAYFVWEGLVSKYGITGRPCYDAKLVAVMMEHRIPRLLTFNDKDFSQYSELTVLNPFDVLGIPRV